MKFKQILKYIFAEDLNLSLEQRLLVSSLVLGIIIAITATILPMFFNQSLQAVLIPAVLAVFLLTAYYFIRFKNKFDQFIIPLLLLAVVGISIIWIFILGVNGTMDLFLASILILSLIVVPQNFTKRVLIFYILFISFLFAVEYFFPQATFSYNSREEKIIDIYIAVLINSLIAYSIIRLLHVNYTKERQKVISSEQRLMLLNEELQELNATKDKFFSIIAHDLKNPIYNLHAVTKLLNSHYETMPEEEFKEFIELTSDSSRNLYNLLDNLLMWANSQQGLVPINFREVKLKHLLVSSVDIITLQAKNKNIEIINSYNEEGVVFIDKNLIDTVMRNLLSNALKFTPNGGKVEIKVTENYKDDKTLLAVSDTGVGIAKEKLGNFFQIGSRNSTLGTEKEPGTGLGLILCKEFVERHGGDIWVESEVGKGSTFYFTLPNKAVMSRPVTERSRSHL